MYQPRYTSHDHSKSIMEKSNSFALIDVNIGDKDMIPSMNDGSEKTEEEIKKNKSSFTTVFKIRKF